MTLSETECDSLIITFHRAVMYGNVGRRYRESKATISVLVSTTILSSIQHEYTVVLKVIMHRGRILRE